MDNTVVVTDKGGLLKPWQPGQSGNPGGRPKVPEELLARMKQVCPQVVEFHIAAMNNPRAKLADRQRSSVFLWENVYGKPPQDVNLGGQDGNPIQVARPLAGLTEDQLTRLEEIMRHVNPTGQPIDLSGSILD